MSGPTRQVMVECFGPETLTAARLASIPARRPTDLLGRMDRLPFDRYGMAAITYEDTILVDAVRFPEEASLPLLFHELVHVVQYRILGTAEFARRYVSGWIDAGRVYRRIPLEVQAYDLEHRFASGERFAESVETLVRAGLVHV